MFIADMMSKLPVYGDYVLAPKPVPTQLHKLKAKTFLAGLVKDLKVFADPVLDTVISDYSDRVLSDTPIVHSIVTDMFRELKDLLKDSERIINNRYGYVKDAEENFCLYAVSEFRKDKHREDYERRVQNALKIGPPSVYRIFRPHQPRFMLGGKEKFLDISRLLKLRADSHHNKDPRYKLSAMLTKSAEEPMD